MPIPTPEERLGTRVADKYTLTRVLGRGGMGVVFEALHLWTGRVVAIKLLLPLLVDDPDVARRFLNEARAATKLKHPHVVDVLDMGRDPDGTVYQVLEWLDGESLAAHLAREHKLSLDGTLAILLPIIDALGVAHGRGVLHRDVKPANIFLRRTEQEGQVHPVLLDFGVAKLRDVPALTTRSGSVVGTPHYMAPEQALGSRDLGPGVDVYAIGVLLFECLSGRLPFEAPSAAAYFSKLLHDDAPRLDNAWPDAPPALTRLVARCLARDPTKRVASMAELMDALLAATGNLALSFRPTMQQERGTAPTPPMRLFGVNPLLLAIGATTLLTAVVGHLRDRQIEQAETAQHAPRAQAEEVKAAIPVAASTAEANAASPLAQAPKSLDGDDLPKRKVTIGRVTPKPAPKLTIAAFPDAGEPTLNLPVPGDMTHEW